MVDRDADFVDLDRPRSIPRSDDDRSSRLHGSRKLQEQHIEADKQGQPALLKFMESASAANVPVEGVEVPEQVREARKSAFDFFGTSEEVQAFLNGSAETWAQIGQFQNKVREQVAANLEQAPPRIVSDPIQTGAGQVEHPMQPDDEPSHVGKLALSQATGEDEQHEAELRAARRVREIIARTRRQLRTAAKRPHGV